MNSHGFTLILERKVDELSSTAKVWQHDKTGACLLSFVNRDENKVFGVSLRTPPHDSTGLPHILEHSVLCGSAKYPVKEPFVELLKGSLQTFLNAFTYPDKTCYPVASANLQDFYNLIDVYLDAVFHPRLYQQEGESIFRQEGWHLDAVPAQDDSAAEPEISFKGVVYNEMKGVFSSPESVLERQSMHAMFPDTPYGLESGGDPADIPSLTFEDFMNFHRKYYHPSNARFYFWGDDPEEKRLEILNEVLKDYDRIDTASSEVAVQAPFSQRKNLRLPFAASEDDKAMFTLNWVLPQVGIAPDEVERTLALAMLEHILLGMPASPLRRALIESGLGEDLTGSGMQDELRQITFSIGLKGIAEENAGQVEEIILQTLRGLVENGIPLPSVEAAVNSLEFALRENNTGRFPVGLAIMLRALTTWLHFADPQAPLAPLQFEAPLASIKSKALSDNGGYFEGLIRAHLLDNEHRASILLYPDSGLSRLQAQEENERLQAKLAQLSATERNALVAETEKLRLMQETPDNPEDLARIPRVQVEDLPLSNQEIRQKSITDRELPVYYHPQPTSGICYLNLHMDMSAVPDKLLPLVPMLGRAMLEMGNAERDFIELNMNIARKTGGMDSEIQLLTRLRDRMPIGSLCLSGKAAPDKIRDLFGLTAELLTRTDLDNQEHIGRMLLEEKARLEHSLVPSGHMFTAGRLKASCSLTGWLADQCGGLGYLDYIRNLSEEVSSNWPGVLKKLQELRKILVNRRGIILNITAEADQEESIMALVSELSADLPDAAQNPVTRAMQNLPEKEALITPAQVNYMGKGMNLYDLGYAYHGSALAILKYLRTGFLWEKVRVQGGAYGAFSTLDRFTGDFVLASYRDPNTSGTLQVFDACAAHLMNNIPGKRELEASIVGAVGELDAYMLPEAKGNSAFARTLTGNTTDIRARVREEVLGTTPDHFRQFGQVLAEGLPGAFTAALGGQALEAYARQQGWEIRKVL
ncbi:insulinase family protein [Desulfovibrio sp. OttesenSCG-928-C06]|nr:insulinase family protein [Desulfovibrio sp. OttesenSCG-928-C06]